MPTAYGMKLRQNYLAHHGIPGQEWGKRNGPPYPLNPEKDYSKEEKKFQKDIAGNKETVIKKGTKMYRMTSGDDANQNTDKMYVNLSPKEFNKYKTMMGTSNILKTGKSYVNEFIANEDIKIPSIKTQTKIERKMLKDPEIRKEMVDSLAAKGMSREEAAEKFKKVNMGAAYAGAILATAGPISLGILSANPGGIIIGGELSVYGALAGLCIIESARERKKEQLDMIRVSVGDKNNTKLTSKFVEELQKKGYTAMRDTNDRKASVGAYSSVILLDPKKQAKLEMRRELSKDEYADAYAANKWNSLSKKQRESINYDSYVKDGEKQYDKVREAYAANKIAEEKNNERKEELNKKLEELDKKKE